MAKVTAVRNFIMGLVTVFAFLLTASAALAQGAGYLKIVTAQGVIEGKSKDPAHLNWIALSSVQMADLNQDGAMDRESSAPSVSEVVATGRGGKPAPPPASASGKPAASDNAVKSPRDLATGQASGKRMHKPITIIKEWDAASPQLRTLQAKGTMIPEVDIYLLAKTGTAEAGHYKLKEVMISSIQTAAGGGAGGSKTQQESVSFTYQKIEWTK